MVFCAIDVLPTRVSSMKQQLNKVYTLKTFDWNVLTYVRYRDIELKVNKCQTIAVDGLPTRVLSMMK